MKKLLVIPGLLLAFSLNAQSEMEIRLFNEFNKYREAKGLDKAVYDKTLSKIAKDQVYYTSLCIKSGVVWDAEKIHNQLYDFPNFDEHNFKQKQERVEKLDSNLFMLDLGEVCYASPGVAGEEKRIIDAWDGSSGHKKCMVQKGKKRLHVGVSFNGKEATLIFGARYDGQ